MPRFMYGSTNDFEIDDNEVLPQTIVESLDAAAPYAYLSIPLNPVF